MINDDLDRLSNTLDFLTDDEAKRILEIVNGKVIDELNAHIVDVLWKAESWDSTTLQPFTGLDKTSRRGAKSLQVATDSPFVWSWVFENREPLWIDDIKARGRQGSVINKATGQIVEREFEVFEDTDSIVAIPLVFRDIMRGVYSIEMPRSGNFSMDVLKQIRWLASPMASLIWKADAYLLSREQHSNAIRQFSGATAEQKLFSTPYRTGFVARPFQEEFNDLDNKIGSYMATRGIRAQHYQHTPGQAIVIDEIRRCIDEAHFGIVDLTGLNPNVLLEFGMMMTRKARIMLLRNKNDVSEVPFDLRAYHVYQYEVSGGSNFRVLDPGTGQLGPIEDQLRAFIDTLETDASFGAAQEWRGG